MKFVKVILPLLVLSFPALGQTNIQIILSTAGNYNIEKVDMFDLSQAEIYDFKYNDTLLFHFKKQNVDCYNIRFHSNGKMVRQQIWLDTGNVKIQARISDDDLIIDTVINAPFYYQAQAFNKEYSELYKTRDTIAINDYLLASFRKHMASPFSINVGFYYVTLNQNSKLNLIKFKTLADLQGDKFRWFLLYPMVVERLNKILTVEKINLSNYFFFDKAKKKVKLPLAGADYYVLVFWFLACAPCVEQHAVIKEKLTTLKNMLVEVIGISTDENLQKWNDYLVKHGYTWPNYLQDRTSNITSDLSISSFPTYMVLNNAGDIVDTYNSISDVLKRFQVKN